MRIQEQADQSTKTRKNLSTRAIYMTFLQLRFPNMKLFFISEILLFIFEGKEYRDIRYGYWDDQNTYHNRFFSPDEFLEKHVKPVENLIHINIEWMEKSFEWSPEPFLFGSTINITLDKALPKSPIIGKDGLMTLWEEDLNDPLFIEMLLEKFKGILCG